MEKHGELYKRLVKRGGKLGYSMVKQAPFESMHLENESDYQKLKPALLNRNPHKYIKLSQNLSILKPLLLHPSRQHLLPHASSSPECKPKYQRATTWIILFKSQRAKTRNQLFLY